MERKDKQVVFDSQFLLILIIFSDSVTIFRLWHVYPFSLFLVGSFSIKVHRVEGVLDSLLWIQRWRFGHNKSVDLFLDRQVYVIYLTL